MNIRQVNHYHIKPLLALLGIEPTSRSGVGYCYRAMYRSDESPSLFVVENRFKDFGTGEHGRTLDLFLKIYNNCSVSEALKKVEALLGGNSKRLALNNNPKLQAQQPKTETLKIFPLSNNALCSYVGSRGIPVRLATTYLKEIYITHRTWTTFYVGLNNESGGYSLRNKSFKRNFGKTDISVFKGKQPGIAVYEGMFDFLSGLHMSEKAKSLTNIILNSTINVHKGIEKIKTIAIPELEIGLFLDADDAGRKATEIIKKELPQAVDYSWVYSQNNLKDLNEYLLMKLKQN